MGEAAEDFLLSDNHGEEYLGLFKSGLGLCCEHDRACRNTHMARTGRPRLTLKRSALLKTLVYPDDAEAFVKACESAKVTPPDALRELAKAWVAHVAKTPHATLHFKLVELK